MSTVTALPTCIHDIWPAHACTMQSCRPAKAKPAPRPATSPAAGETTTTTTPTPAITGEGIELDDTTEVSTPKPPDPAIEALNKAIAQARRGNGNAAADHAANALVTICEQYGLFVHEYLRTW